MTHSILYLRAQRRAAMKLGFYMHLAVFIVVGLFMAGINIFLMPSVLWFYWPIIGWGAGVTAHGVVTFYGEKLLERMTAQELERPG